MAVRNKFKPLNYKLLCKFLIKMRKKNTKKVMARNKATNQYVRLRHIRSKLHSLLGTARRSYYGKHLFVCYYLTNLLKKASSYSIIQGLVQKKVGFQNLRNFFSQIGVTVFLLARKDMNYLKTYTKNKKSNFSILFFGGYTFLVYVAEAPNFIGTDNSGGVNIIRTVLNPFINYYKLFLKKEGLNIMSSSKLVSSVRIYPLIIKFAGYYFAKDVVLNYINSTFFEVLDRNLYAFENILQQENVEIAIKNRLNNLISLNSKFSIYEVLVKLYIANLIFILLYNKINMIRLFLYRVNEKYINNKKLEKDANV
jgi:hypothetical protein